MAGTSNSSAKLGARPISTEPRFRKNDTGEVIADQIVRRKPASAPRSSQGVPLSFFTGASGEGSIRTEAARSTDTSSFAPQKGHES